ncbi:MULTISPECIES: heme ABC transporter ATP-binding protein [unclassified Pseudomonas]|uniref:heme ABC transporter ATP-binding protein n=1 Tax=unclassified Pseudomonas TaxID=196821 RepID=UPI000D37E2F2|nr:MULTISPECIES: heme ABC transporter ATP-binding protein [unclassified Pseudomonas]RAU41372.1 heme ABC transporter ATP-binding protein [Pseudomonas sp. RIT 409]RAU48380.1 heme ABC transporter ATP-binding protein [Pseudomonas sp. RIT 412]
MMQVDALSIHRNGTCVLSDISLTLQPRQVLGVLGPNGAGKSTLLGALCGELKATHGQPWLDGQPLSSWSAQARATRLAVLPQSSSLSFGFDVREIVAMGRLPHGSGRDRDAEIVQAALEAADASHLQGRSYLALSGGERQRVHLARVLAQVWSGEGGQTLLLDEPTSMLDPLHQHTLLQAVRGFADRGGAVMVILHDLNLAARYCDRLMLLQAGRTYVSGTPDDVLTPDALQAVFGLEVLVRPHPERGYPLIIAR